MHRVYIQNYHILTYSFCKNFDEKASIKIKRHLVHPKCLELVAIWNEFFCVERLKPSNACNISFVRKNLKGKLSWKAAVEKHLKEIRRSSNLRIALHIFQFELTKISMNGGFSKRISGWLIRFKTIWIN